MSLGLLSMSTGGQRLKKREEIQRPLMKTQDSEVKKSMKSVMRMGRKDRPKLEAPMRRYEGM